MKSARRAALCDDLRKMGIPAAAGLINFVVLTAALSSCNNGIFSTGRMLYNLAQQEQALPMFAKVGRTACPMLRC